MILTIHKHLFLLLESELLVIRVYKISVRVCKNIFNNKLKVLDFKKKKVYHIYIYIYIYIEVRGFIWTLWTKWRAAPAGVIGY